MQDAEYEMMRKSSKDRLLKQMDYTRDLTDAEVLELIDEEVLRQGKSYGLTLSQKNRLQKELFSSIRRLDVLEEFLGDDTVTEIMINGPDCIFIERNGCLSLQKVQFESKEKLEDVIQQIVAKVNRVVNEASPIVDARLQNGARVNVVMSPVALNGPIVTIRRFPDHPMDVEDLYRLDSVSKEVMDFLKQLIKAGYNIFVSGGTGSGKTTFLNVLSNFIPKDERIITIEDNAELQIQNIPNLVRLETRNANVEGCKPITIRDLIKAALRMRPDRIIVGEVRSEEAIDLLMAMNTGHDGSLSTGHANSAKDMLSRLETMVLMGMEMPLDAVRRQIASAVDVIVHLGRLRDHSRKVLEITEVIGYVGGEIVLSPLYTFVEDSETQKGKVTGCLKKRDSLKNTQKLQNAGIILSQIT
ncbi:MAG: CpaF family protein [Lachnospiraceae bacterium]|nr:CpaF family protein [Lachnospiraceae bacterium]